MEAAVSQEQTGHDQPIATYFQKRLLQRETRTGLTDGEVRGLSREELYARIEKAVGWTGMNRFSLPNGNTLFQKNETGNPTETHYDRCYVHLIKNLELEGKIRPGDMLLETTSGSAGVSFAWACKKLGYEAVVFMPAFVPEPRILEVRRLASAVHLSDDRATYLLGCSNQMVAFYRQNLRAVRGQGRNIFMPNHSQDFLTPRIFESIMNEVDAHLEGEKIDYFIGGIGNGSTILGIGERLKNLNPAARIIAFEPASSCPFYKRQRHQWGKVGPVFIADEDIPEGFSFHQLPGTGGYGNIDFPFMDAAFEKGLIDDICAVPDADILASVTYNDGIEEEFKLGNSSLISRHIADALVKQVSDKNILVIAYDRADRYGKPRYL